MISFQSRERVYIKETNFEKFRGECYQSTTRFHPQGAVGYRVAGAPAEEEGMIMVERDESLA